MKDNSYHAIIEDIFRIVENERHAYLRSTDSISKKTQLASRLSQCAAALRSTVEIGVCSLRLKTVKALIHHVTETLHVVGHEYCQPLLGDYLKTLRCLLAHSSHVEHLLHQDWEYVVEFCLNCLQSFVPQPVSRAKGHYDCHVTINTDITSHYTSDAEFEALAGQKPTIESSSSEVLELVSCLRYLYHNSNFFQGDHANKIGILLSQCLRAAVPSANINLEAFKLINTLLSKIYVETKQVAVEYVKVFIPCVKTQWITKSTVQKDEMLVTLAYLVFPSAVLIMDEKMGSIRRELESVLEVIFSDYARRAQKDQLQIDDITLRTCDHFADNRPVLSTIAFHLRPSVIRAESHWALLSLLSKYSSLLDKFYYNQHREETSRVTNNNVKRQRHSFHIVDNLQYLKHSHSATKVAALQLTCFMVQERKYEEETLVKVVQKLLDCISGDYGITSSWAMVALTGFVMALDHQDTANAYGDALFNAPATK